jgi:hypothetical protein
MAAAAFAISILALIFTVGSFYWLNARRGSITAVVPEIYAFVEGFRLRLPLAFLNDGAIPILVSDLRIEIVGVGYFPWQTTRTILRPEENDGSAFATPFTVPQRGTKHVIAEFGDDVSWMPRPGSEHQLRMEARIHPDDGWEEIFSFPWFAPPTEAHMNRYIAHRNEPSE